MKTDFLRAFAGAFLTLAALAGTAVAQDMHLTGTTDLNDLYTRLEALESRVAATGTTGGGCGGASDCCDDYCKAGFVGGAEAVWLKAFNSDGDYGDFNYDEAFRFWVGYQRADGLGIRFRYFDADLDADYGTGEFIETTHSDLEFFDSLQLGCNWDVVIGGGIRYLDYFEDVDGDTQEINGVGPVLTAELYRHVSDRAALYAIARESIIVGDGISSGTEEVDLTTAISEIQLGLQLHREVNGGLVFGRIGWEAQHYNDIVDGEDSTTLMGVAFSGGIMR